MDQFRTAFQEISEFPSSARSGLIASLRSKLKESSDDSKKSMIGVCTLVIGYFLLDAALIKDLNLGPFRIKDVGVVLYFMPVISAYLLFRFSSQFFYVNYLNYLIYCVEIKHFGLKKESVLHQSSLFNSELKFGNTKEETTYKKSERKGCRSCLFALPFLVVVLFALIGIPFLYYMVIKFTFKNLGVTFFNSPLLDWLPLLFTITFLLLSIRGWFKIFRFLNFKYYHDPYSEV